MKSKDLKNRCNIPDDTGEIVKSSISRTHTKSDSLFQKSIWSIILICMMLFSNSGKAQLSTYSFTQTAGTYVSVTGGTTLVAGGTDSGASGVTNIWYSCLAPLGP